MAVRADLELNGPRRNRRTGTHTHPVQSVLVRPPLTSASTHSEPPARERSPRAQH